MYLFDRLVGGVGRHCRNATHSSPNFYLMWGTLYVEESTLSMVPRHRVRMTARILLASCLDPSGCRSCFACSSYPPQEQKKAPMKNLARRWPSVCCFLFFDSVCSAQEQVRLRSSESSFFLTSCHLQELANVLTHSANKWSTKRCSYTTHRIIVLRCNLCNY